MDSKALKGRHVQQIARARTIIAAAASRLIRRQFRSAADRLQETHTPSIGAIFDPRDWDQQLKEDIGPAIGHVMLLGAASELAEHHALRGKKSTASDVLARLGIDLEAEGISTEMPDDLVDSITATLADSFERDYWGAVNDTTRNDLEDLLARGTSQGLSIRAMSMQIGEIAHGYSRTRSNAIARTESSRALNSGHVQGMRTLEDETGLRWGKTWLSILGSTTRETHAAADGQTVAVGEPFILGGFPCQFPGDADLPAEESVNCQCTVTSSPLESEE